MVIYNQYDRPIADTINYGENWEYFKFDSNGTIIPGGIGGIQVAQILPDPLVTDRYYAFYTTVDRSNPNLFYNKYQILYAQFEVGKRNKEGNLISKDVKILEDSLSGSITTVRHGHGRDWWLIAPRRNGIEANIFLIDPEGIHFQMRYHTGMANTQRRGGVGQVYASPDGHWVSWFSAGEFTKNGGRLILSRFDRCTGQLYDSSMKVVESHHGMGMGVSFSPNSRYLYMSNQKYIYQYNLSHAAPLKSENQVAVYDGYGYIFPENPTGWSWSVDFCFLGLAPDGRIYVSPSSGGTRMMSVIEYPNERGSGCTVRQHSVVLPTVICRGIPNFPPYRMVPEDGSTCDTLGIDNHPVAKYRYEADSTDYLRLRFTDVSYYRPEVWIWDFGDGSPRVNTQSPYHIFPKKGTYRVCLTVSNENSSNTVYREITLGTSGNEDSGRSAAEVTLYPNPVIDYMLVTLGDYVPASGEITIVDLQGKIVARQRIYYGQNTVDLRHLAQGLYAWILRDGDNIVKEGKLVKR